MRIVLSKKGFDTSFGGYPSIIDGTALYSMAIPEEGNPHSYADLKTLDGKNLFDTVESYYKSIYINGKAQKFAADIKCHADPNISNYFQRDNFLGSLGQVNEPQKHLENQGITVGDIFIFFGWFKEKNGKGRHVAFGYLQIGEIIKTHGLTEEQRKAKESQYPWLKDQPHWENETYKKNPTNTIYAAAEKCTFDPNLKGYGVFTYNSGLDLTAPDARTMGQWKIPQLSGLTLSWNSGTIADDGNFKLTAKFGQEFVVGKSDKAIEWAENLIKNHAKR